MFDKMNTQFSLLDEVSSRLDGYPDNPEDAVFQAWKDLGVALTVLLIFAEQDDVVDGVNNVFKVASILSDKVVALHDLLVDG